MSHRRRRRHGPRGARPAPNPSGQAGTLASTAELIRREFRRRGADFVPLEVLVTSGVTEPQLRAAVDQSRDLGIGGPARRPVVWRVDPAPLAAGFEPVYDGERLALQLLGAGSADRLLINGRHLDPRLGEDLNDNPTTTAPRYGELSYALARLEVMSTRWLSGNHELFELIGRAWRASASPVWSSGRLHVHCADLGEPIATRFWRHNGAANRLELVVWEDPRDELVLVNVYPCAIEHSITDSEDQST